MTWGSCDSGADYMAIGIPDGAGAITRKEGQAAQEGEGDMTTEQKALVVRSPSVSEFQALGAILAKSGFFADAKQEAQAITKVLAGYELGIAPIASMTGIHIIQGKVALGAQLMGACIKRSPRYDWKVKEHTDLKCAIEFYERSGIALTSLGVSTFTMEDARKAGLLGKPGGNWEKFPRNMLWARAMSNGARWLCPDVFGGAVYVPEEIGAIVDVETGEIIEGQVRDVTPTDAPKSTQQPAPSPTPAKAGAAAPTPIVDEARLVSGPTPAEGLLFPEVVTPPAPVDLFDKGPALRTSAALAEQVPTSVPELVKRSWEKGIGSDQVCLIASDVTGRKIIGPGQIAAKDIPGVWAGVLSAAKAKERKP